MFIAKILLCASSIVAVDPGVNNSTHESPQIAPMNEMVDGVELAAIEANIVKYTNEERVRHGLEPLVVDEQLMETARSHTQWMTRNHSLTHSHGVAENIAMGQPHSSDAVQAWMNSPGHRANMLNSNHRRIGVAAYQTESGTIYWCQQFRG
ncbi:MAG: hypothetical protein JW959_15220 [Pirellulales bacterium]|nr:hypothetical protein [Pirellulales bacterium]